MVSQRACLCARCGGAAVMRVTRPGGFGDFGCGAALNVAGAQWFTIRAVRSDTTTRVLVRLGAGLLG